MPLSFTFTFEISTQVGSLQGEINDLKTEILRLKQEVKKRDGIIESLRNDIDGLKKEIQERDDTIQDKVLLYILNCNNPNVITVTLIV